MKSQTALYFSSVDRQLLSLLTSLMKCTFQSLGTLPEQIDAAEDREKFDEILESLDIKRPKGKGVWSVEEGIAVANELRLPSSCSS